MVGPNVCRACDRKTLSLLFGDDGPTTPATKQNKRKMIAAAYSPGKSRRGDPTGTSLRNRAQPPPNLR